MAGVYEKGEFYNRVVYNILELAWDEIVEYECQQGRKAEEDAPAFCDAVSDFFSEGYPKENMGKVFLG